MLGGVVCVIWGVGDALAIARSYISHGLKVIVLWMPKLHTLNRKRIIKKITLVIDVLSNDWRESIFGPRR